jgi:hypothetical protein
LCKLFQNNNGFDAKNLPVFLLKQFLKVFTFLFRQSASTIAPSEKGFLGTGTKEQIYFGK